LLVLCLYINFSSLRRFSAYLYISMKEVKEILQLIKKGILTLSQSDTVGGAGGRVFTPFGVTSPDFWRRILFVFA